MILGQSVAFARDRKRGLFDFDDSPSAPQRNPEADKHRAEADQAYQRGEYQRVIELSNLLLTRYGEDNPHVAYHMRASAQIELGRQARSSKQIRDGIADARQALSLEGRKYTWLYIPYLYGLTSLSEIEKRREHADMTLQVVAPLLQRPVTPEFSADDKANLTYQQGLAHVALGDLKSATSDFTEAVRLSPQSWGAHIKLAETLAAQNQTKAALAAYDAAVRQFPNAVVVYNNRGNFRRTAGDLDGAVADFTRALQIDPKFALGYVNRGVSLTDQDNPKAAEGDFSEALKLPLDPVTQLMTYRLRAIARASQGNPKGAVADYTAAMRLAPQDATLYEERGCARFFLKDFSGSAADFAAALKLNPQLVRVSPWQAVALARGGKPDASRAILDGVAGAKSPPPEWIVKLNDFLSDRMTDEELLAAAADPDEALQKARLCEARFFIGQKKLLANEMDPAAEQFREAVATQANAVTAFRGARYELGDFSRN